ncbi:zinc-ribbon domain-containing protein [Nocardia sp. CA-084685]|uniref:zinc-ribbon domain-containing protein n=1 Tax=Nocardia sp. CA-084685 TaxID=3239970 RepID=UPI003D963B88
MITLVCGRCGNPAAHALRRLATTFTVFFIPILPLGNKHYMECTWCGASTPLAVPQVTGLIARANAERMGSTQYQQPPQGAPNGQWPTPDAHNAHPLQAALAAPNSRPQQPALAAPHTSWQQQPAPSAPNAHQQQPAPNTNWQQPAFSRPDANWQQQSALRAPNADWRR